jgi:DNA-binding GntR family transcriptional regulator
MANSNGLRAATPVDIGAALRARREVSLTTLVRQEIERSIEAGELKAGDWINEALVASRLGVSRGPVREACRGLEQSGLVTVIVNRGAFIRDISVQDARDLYELRAALFGFAGYLLAPTITEAGTATLLGLYHAMHQAAAEADLDRYYGLNLSFHATIFAMAGNSRLASDYNNSVRELHLFRRRALVSPGRMEASNIEHAAIIDALAGHDCGRARALMEAHVLDSRDRVVPAAPADLP